jgi:cell division protein FtsI/penicillin-binding protein 2
MGDLIGNQGIEKSYEEILRGVKGIKFIQKDRFNRDLGPYKDGIYDTLPKQGKDITITIDSKLQEYGELLMQHKRGGIIFSLRASDTSELILEDVRIPKTQMLEGVEGLKGPHGCLTQARYGIAFGAIGAAQAAFDEACR